MRLFSIVILIGLSACATTQSEIDVSNRTASWLGAPVDELVAVLGHPASSSEDRLIWNFQGTGRRQAGNVESFSATANSLTQPLAQPCSNCDRSSTTSPPGRRVSSDGMSTQSHGTQKNTGHGHCTYTVYVDNETVSKLTTSGRHSTGCRFDELPLRTG